VPDSNYYSGAG